MLKIKNSTSYKLKKVLNKLIGSIGILSICMQNSCYAVDEVTGGGAIQESKIGTGIMNMIKDVTGTLQWIIPVAGVMVILYYIFKITKIK